VLNVVSDPPGSNLSRNKYLSDEGRRIRFSMLGSVGKGEIQAFLLEWHGHSIAVTSQMTERTDGQGESYVLYSAPMLNGSAAQLFTIPAWEPRNQQQRAEVEKVAAECLVAFGWGYKGLQSPDGAYRVLTPDGELSLSSFTN